MKEHYDCRIAFLKHVFRSKECSYSRCLKKSRYDGLHLTANLVTLGFSGEIYPVNLGSDEILGMKAYPNLTSIEGDIDLVVSAVPTHAATIHELAG